MFFGFLIPRFCQFPLPANIPSWAFAISCFFPLVVAKNTCPLKCNQLIDAGGLTTCETIAIYQNLTCKAIPLPTTIQFTNPARERKPSEGSRLYEVKDNNNRTPKSPYKHSTVSLLHHKMIFPDGCLSPIFSGSAGVMRLRQRLRSERKNVRNCEARFLVERPGCDGGASLSQTAT